MLIQIISRRRAFKFCRHLSHPRIRPQASQTFFHKCFILNLIDIACLRKHTLPVDKSNTEKRVQILRCPSDKSSIHATVDLVNVSIHGVVKLLIEVGNFCSEYEDCALRNLKYRRLQCDEIWLFDGCNETNTTP